MSPGVAANARRRSTATRTPRGGHRSAVSTRKGGGFYGYLIHLVVDTATDLPLAWSVETARNHETLSVVPLLDRLHLLGMDPETCALDRGYDNNRVYAACLERGIAPVIPSPLPLLDGVCPSAFQRSQGPPGTNDEHPAQHRCGSAPHVWCLGPIPVGRWRS
jgi:hypothetical protein